MKTKIKSLIAFVMLSGASLTILFALPHTQPNADPQTAPPGTVPSIVSTSSDKGGMHTRADTVLPSARYGAHINLNQPSVTLDKLDVRSVPLKAPNQIGVNRSVAVSPTTRAQKFVNPDGSQIIVLIIKSSGASGMGVHFRNFALAGGEEVYVYGPAADSIVFGPFTNKGPWSSGEFWSGTLDGNTAIIEFYTRTGESRTAFEVFEISHIFPELDLRLRFGEPDVLSCEVDASCLIGFNLPPRHAVGRILYNNNGLYVCTGTLLNDRAQDFIPYFLTANTCVSTQAVAQTVEVYWFYQTTGCDTGVLQQWVHTGPGANLLATQNSNDFSLLRLVNNAPGGAVFSGWSAIPLSTGDGVYGLHHPSGGFPPSAESYLRVSNGPITSTNADCAPSGLVNGYLTGWTHGTTEPGSYGSGLFSSGSLVGVLSCVNNPVTCSSPSGWYSKFANFYSQIRPYIDPVTLGSSYDFNRDGHPDYVLYNASTRGTAVWYLNNNVYIGGAYAPILGAGWALADVADFNGDGHPDYALFNSSTRQTAIAYLSGVTLLGNAYGPTLPSGWALVATGDFNGDGKPDYVLYNASSHQTAIWYLNNNVYVSGGYGPTLPAGWQVVGVADFDLDGHADYLLFNPTNRQSAIWYMSGRSLLRGVYGPTIASGYQLKGAADFNGDGKPDYVLFNVSTPQTAIWYMNNNVRIGYAYGPTLTADWILAAP